MQAGREEETQGRVYGICTASQSLNFSIPLLQLFISKYKSVYIEYPCMGMHVLPKPSRQRIPSLCSTHKLQLLKSRRGSDAPASKDPPSCPLSCGLTRQDSPPQQENAALPTLPTCPAWVNSPMA